MTYRITAIGIANAGKSALLSALAGQRNRFPPGDVPGVTRSVQSHVAGPWTLIDTPGLDVCAEDSQLANLAREGADTLLWCHSLRIGELRPTELAALERRASRRGALARTCFVLTHADDVAGYEELRCVSQRIAQQLEGTFGLPFVGVGESRRTQGEQRAPRVLNLVGVNRFWLASSAPPRHRAQLLRRSGVPQLQSFLLSLALKQARDGHV